MALQQPVSSLSPEMPATVAHGRELGNASHPGCWACLECLLVVLRAVVIPTGRECPPSTPSEYVLRRTAGASYARHSRQAALRQQLVLERSSKPVPIDALKSASLRFTREPPPSEVFSDVYTDMPPKPSLKRSRIPQRVSFSDELEVDTFVVPSALPV